MKEEKEKRRREWRGKGREKKEGEEGKGHDQDVGENVHAFMHSWSHGAYAPTHGGINATMHEYSPPVRTDAYSSLCSLPFFLFPFLFFPFLFVSSFSCFLFSVCALSNA